MIDIQDLFQGNGNTAGSSGQAGQVAQNGQEGANSPTSRSPLVSLKRDLEFYKDSIQEVSHDVLESGYSDYPIFVAHQHQVQVGEIILDREELGTQWTIQVSSLEEFVEKNIVKADKKEKFIQTYKDPQQFMCLFVIVPEGANFVFYPYGSTSENS